MQIKTTMSYRHIAIQWRKKVTIPNTKEGIEKPDHYTLLWGYSVQL